MRRRALRGTTLSFARDPFLHDPAACIVSHDDGLVVLRDDRIASVGPYPGDGDPSLATLEVTHYPNAIICPGFIDGHVHYPQVEMIAGFGEQLLGWLETYTFPTEQRFADRAHADRVAAVFLRELLRAGTTTAAVYCTVHPASVDAFFAELARFNTRMIAGKVLMDRNAPEALRDTAESGYTDSRALIERWHAHGRQLYCVTPRFAPTSSDAQLEAAARLWREHPGTFVQTHLAENIGEVAWVRKLFPGRSSYLDVYHHAGLTGPRSIFGHALHMSEGDFACCNATGSALAHCPTSNLFLGSGLFRAFEAKRADRPVRVCLGTDVGGGTSLSQLQSLNEAYKVSAMAATKLHAEHAFYLATRGGAEALYLDDRIGSLEPGFEADIIVLDLAATPLIRFRTEFCRTLAERLFVLMMLGDDRAVRAMYVAGELVYDRERGEAFRYPG